MKQIVKQFILSAGVIIISVISAKAQPQLSRWHIAPNMINLSTGTPTSSPGVITGSNTATEYNSMCDNAGNLDLYIANKVIYDRFGNILKDLKTAPVNCSSNGSNDIAIVPSPGNLSTGCQRKYFIVYHNNGTTLNGVMDFCTITINSSTGAATYTGTPYANGFGVVTAAVTSMAVTRVQSNGKRYLYFVSSSSTNNIGVAEITNSGVTLIGSLTYANSAEFTSELELSDNGDKLAFTINGSGGIKNVIIAAVTPGNLVPTSITTISSGFINPVSGLEFDNTGNKIFFSQRSKGVYVSTGGTPVQISTGFDVGNIEKVFNGDIACASATTIQGFNTTSYASTWSLPYVLPSHPHSGLGYNTVLMPNQIDGENYTFPAYVLVPSFTTPLSICDGTAFAVDGSASYGTINGVVTPGMITSHVWIISECTSAGVPFGPDWWSPFFAGAPGLYSFPTSLPGGPTVQCGKYYLIKLAVQNTCIPWAETTLKILVNCKPTANAGPDVTICNGSCTNIGDPFIVRSTSYSWSSPSGPAGNTSQINVCPTTTTTYTLTVTKTTTGCINTDVVTVFVDNTDATFNTYTNTSNPSYGTVTVSPNQISGFPAGFLYVWIVEELDATLTTLWTVTSSDGGIAPCWWPGNGVPTSFPGLTVTSPTPFLSNTCTPSQGRFGYNRIYRITYGVQSTNCPWKQTSQLATPSKSSNGGFTFVEDENAPDMSNYLSARSVRDRTYENSIDVYPNPGSGMFFFSLKGNSITSMEVYDITGKVVKILKTEDYSNGTIDLSGYSKGLYLIKAVVDGQPLTQKINLE